MYLLQPVLKVNLKQLKGKLPEDTNIEIKATVAYYFGLIV